MGNEQELKPPRDNLDLEPANRGEWLAKRRQGIGASESPALFGASRYASPLSLYLRKTQALPESDAPAESATWGLELEGVIAAYYGKATGRPVHKPKPYTLYRSRQHPHLTCSPDAFVLDPAKGWGILQVKTASAWLTEEWTEPSVYAQIQNQHEMLAAGVTWGAVCVLIGGQEFRHWDQDPHLAFQSRLIEATLEFWHRLLTLDPPPPDSHVATKAMLEQMFPRHTPGKALAMPLDALTWDEVRQEAEAAIAAWSERLQWAENHLKAALGDAERGILHNGIEYTWKAETIKAHYRKESVRRPLRRVDRVR